MSDRRAPAEGTPPPQADLDYVTMLHEAQALVRKSVLWRRFIDGTPLENDIAVWMVDFAVSIVKRSAPAPAPDARPEEP